MRIGSYNSSFAAASLTRTNSAIARALERLSTGQRVSRPSDDVAAYSMGVKLESQIRGLSQSVRNIQETQGLLNVSESSVSSQLDLVQRMREIALQASSSLISQTERSGLESELKNLLKDFERITKSTEETNTRLNLTTSSLAESFTKTIGSGSFEARQSFYLGSTGASGTPTDFNGDGHLDLFNSDRIWFGNGDGSFSAYEANTGASISGAIAVDINGDGAQDLMGFKGDTLIVLAGLGDGSFAAEVEYVTSPSYTITDFDLGDVDGDGDADVVVSSTTTNEMILMLNDGEGAFTFSATIEDGGNVGFGIELLDLNNDGLADLVTYDDSFSLAQYLSTGSGIFGSENVIGSVAAATLTAEDIDNDGDQDLLLYNSGASNIFIRQNNSGSWASKTVTPVGTSHRDLRVMDLNNDGLNDLVGLSPSEDFISVFMGTGGGNFSAGKTIQTSTAANRLVVGDMNGDGAIDLLTSETGYMNVYLGRSVEASALSDVSVASEEKAAALLKILDSTLEKLSKDQANIASIHSRLDYQEASSLLLAENLENSRENILQADLAIETAELLRLQILQEAQIAVRAQSNLQLHLILKLLDGLE